MEGSLISIWQVYAALAEWRTGAWKRINFHGELYSHLYRALLDRMYKLERPKQKKLSALQVRIAEEGLYVVIPSCIVFKY